MPEWFPLRAFWNWHFYWFFSNAWVQCGTVTAVIITIAKPAEEWARPDLLNRWKKKTAK